MTCPPGALRYALVSLEVRGNGDCDSDSDVAVRISLLDPYSLVHAESRVYAEAIIAMSSSASGRSRRCLRWRCGIGDGGAGGPGMPLLRGTGEEGDHKYWKQIEKDVPRVALSPDIPASTNFRRTADAPDGEAYHQSEAFRASLGRCLHAYARRHDEVGYVQGMHNVLAFMLISGLGEEESVLLLHHIATRVLPMYWHTNDSSGKGGGNSSNSSNTILTDVLVAGFIARRELPALTHHLESIGVDLSHVTLPLFLTCFTANSMSYEFVASCWDFLLFESQPLEGAATSADEDTTNNSFMFRLILAMLKMFESELKAAADAVACIRALTSMPLRFTTGAEGVQMSVRELLLTTSEFAESCSPKQIRLLRRELASFNSAEDSPNGDGSESGNGDSPRSFQLYRSLSDSHGALQDQIDMLMETLTIQVRPLVSKSFFSFSGDFHFTETHRRGSA